MSQDPPFRKNPQDQISLEPLNDGNYNNTNRVRNSQMQRDPSIPVDNAIVRTFVELRQSM